LAYSPKLISQGHKTSAQYPGQIFRQVTSEGMGCRAVSGQICGKYVFSFRLPAMLPRGPCAKALLALPAQ
jgi:hypothetical protein